MKMLNYAELKTLKGIDFTRQHLARLEAQKKFPLRVRQGEHHIAWLEKEIDDWITSKITARAA